MHAGLLAKGHAHVWVLQITSDILTDEDYEVLSVEEREAAARFLRAPDRVRYVRAHVALRRLLATYMDMHPGRLRVEKTLEGKPYVATGDLEFNLSHSGRFVAVGVCIGGEIGIDIEEIRATDYRNLAQSYFAPHEFAWMMNAPESEQLVRFSRLWVVKEALVKATGAGLSALADAALSCSEDSMPPLQPALADWYAEEFHGIPGYSTAVVVRRGVRVCWRDSTDAVTHLRGQH